MNGRPVASESCRVLAVVPARGGSKSIPRKNLAPLAGRPMIVYTIEPAIAANCISRLVVTTDSPEIAEVARNHGAEVPFLRPIELARDDTPGIDPILHAVRWLEEHEGYRADYVMVLQPTSPFRTPEDIRGALRLAEARRADAVVTVSLADHHPYWMKRLDESGRLQSFISLDRPYTRRQDMPPAYALNGAIYLARWAALLSKRTFYTENTYAYVMPQERSLDVDSPWDLYLADLVMRHRKDHAGN